MMIKKWCIAAAVFFGVIGVGGIQAATPARVTAVRSVFRTDVQPAFSRTVVTVDQLVIPRLVITGKGSVVKLTLPQTVLSPLLQTSLQAKDNEPIQKIMLTQQGTRTTVAMYLAQAIGRDDVRFFSLPPIAPQKKGMRLVMDLDNRRQEAAPGETVSWTEQSRRLPPSVPVVAPVGSDFLDAGQWQRLRQGVKGKRICLDPGHGGSDVGAAGRMSQEKNLTLAIARRTAAILTAAGAKAVLTRSRDVDVFAPHDGAVEELQARCTIANAYGAEIMVCIHINSSENTAIRGVETFYNGKTPYDYSLAKYIHTRVLRTGVFPDRGVHSGDFYMLLHTDMPAVLMELGFISNEQDEKILNTEERQQQLAASIAEGVAEYFIHRKK